MEILNRLLEQYWHMVDVGAQGVYANGIASSIKYIMAPRSVAQQEILENFKCE